MATGQGIQAILGASQFTPDVSRAASPLINALVQRGQMRRQDEQIAQQEMVRDLGAFAFSVLQQPPELRRQALTGRLTQAKESGDEQLATNIEQMLQMDDASLHSDLVQDLATADKQLPGLLNQVAGGRDSGLRAFAPVTVRKQVGVDENGNPIFQNFQRVDVWDPNTGKLTFQETPIEGDILTSTGETIAEKRKAEVSKKAEEERIKAGIEQETVAGIEREKAGAKAKEERRQSIIGAGVTAAAQIGDVYRGLELVDKVEQGGIAAFQKDVTDFFGTTPADVGELNKILAGNVLAGLSAFTGAISEGERQFIEKMETSLRSGRDVNRRQLERLKKTYEKAITKAVDAAKRSDDFDTLSSIRFDIEGTSLGDKLFKMKSGSANNREQTGQRVGRFIVEAE